MNSGPLRRDIVCADLLHAFLEDVRGRGRTLDTIETYRWQLKKYLEFLAEDGLAIESVAENDIRRFLDQKRSRGLKSASIYIAASAVRQFHSFLKRRKICPGNPARKITPQLPCSRIPQVLTIAEVEELLASTCGGRFRNLRARAAISLMYATGIRARELSGIREVDLDMDRCDVRVTGKGGRDRTVPFPRRLTTLMNDYLAEKRRRLPSHPFIFVNSKGRPISCRGLWRELKWIAQRVGLSKKVSPVILRHTFATHLMWGGADLRSIQALLGHRELSTTAIYTQLDDGHVQKTYVQAHPLANGQLEARQGSRSKFLDSGATQ